MRPDLLPVPPLEQLRQRRSAKWQAFGPDVLPLWVAEMDFELAPAIAATLAEAVRRSDTGYAWQIAELGRALAGFAGDRWGWQVDPAAVHPVSDVGVGVVDLLRALTRPGDAVLISPPVYPPFFTWVAEVRGRLVEVPLRHSDGWRLDLPALEAAFAERPAAYVLCNPHNPVGRVHARQELAELVELARHYQVPIISDEVHAPLALPRAEFTPLLSLPGAAEVAVSVHAASKAWNLAGLKAAAIITGSSRMAEVAGRLPDNRWRVGHFGVLASIAAYTEEVAWLDRLLATLLDRRTQLQSELAERLPSVRWHPPEASYLAWLDCAGLGIDDPAEAFLRHGVAVEAGSKFGAIGRSHVRLNFGTSAEILSTAVDRMAKAAD
ncbi:MAG TPA: aminotransferase class I/II-fold pyridoxal phosphate-dependent enzyme [Jatrophihabitans sp.]|nr:aminotransferase class I/II-fold pyridoxal phosphate-dependent enzyme [Jatrophihabitans sp.]